MTIKPTLAGTHIAYGSGITRPIVVEAATLSDAAREFRAVLGDQLTERRSKKGATPRQVS